MKNVLALIYFLCRYDLFFIFSWKLHLINGNNEDFCKKFNVPSNLTHLRFTDRPNVRVSAAIGDSKMIHCCAAGYDSIEWYVNGTRITNKPQKLSTFILIPGQPDNRTTGIRSDEVIGTDNGNYTCVVRNSTHSLQASVNLMTAVKENQIDEPIWTNEPNEIQCGNVGDSLIVPCEAYIGYEGARKDISNIIWVKDGIHNKFLDEPDEDGKPTGINLNYTYKEDGAVIGCILNIPNISFEHYGNYTCDVSFPEGSISKSVILKEGDDCRPKEDLWYETAYVIVIICLIIFTVLFVSMLIFIIKWKLEIQLFLIHQFGRLEDNDDKIYDIFICYDPEDADFTQNILVPTIEKIYQYRCFVYERDTLYGMLIPEIFSIEVQASRRFLMILSPSLIRNTWCIYSLYMAVKAVLECHSKIICIVLEDISWSRIKLQSQSLNYKALRQILKVVKKVYWEPGPLIESNSVIKSEKYELKKLHGGSSKFWKSLLVHLPPKRYGRTENNNQVFKCRNFDSNC